MSVDILGNLFDFYFEMKNMSPFTGYWNLGCFLRVQHGYSAAINGFDFENVCSKCTSDIQSNLTLQRITFLTGLR